MSTRSTTHFKWKSEDESPAAIVYRHPDGYPEGHGRFLVEFLDDLEANVTDTRFTDPTYLAARLVVALAREFNVKHTFDDGKFVTTPNDHPLDFLSIGVVMEDPGDIEYRYEIICSGGRPEVLVFERTGSWDSPTWMRRGPIKQVLSEQDAQAGF